MSETTATSAPTGEIVRRLAAGDRLFEGITRTWWMRSNGATEPGPTFEEIAAAHKEGLISSEMAPARMVDEYQLTPLGRARIRLIGAWQRAAMDAPAAQEVGHG